MKVIDIVTTALELAGIGLLVVCSALSPIPWLAFGVGGVGLIFISRGLSR